MFRPGILAPGRFTPATLVLLTATLASAQHHGGQGITTGNVGLSRPDGVDEKDTLKDFHHAVAVQATGQQISEFQEIVKLTTAAQDKLHPYPKADKSGRGGTSPFDQALERVRFLTRKFQEGFSEPQKSGLKELTKRLEKADTDLGQEAERFDQSVQSESAEVSTHAVSLDKALTDFSNAQLALGREMGIPLATGQDLAFTLPMVTTHVNTGRRSIAVDVSGALSQTAVDGDQRTFQIETVVDLTEVQQSLTEIMNAQLYSEGCGARLTVNRASIVAASPSSSLQLRLHYERWSCMRIAGQTSMTELAESDGTVEIKLTPAISDGNAPRLNSEFKRIDATGAMADDLRTGDLGDTVRDKVSSAILRAVMAGADLKSILRGALQNGATLQSVRFQDRSGSSLKAVLQGQIRLSNDQVTLLANQLNRTLSAQGSPAAATPSPAPLPQTK